MKNIKFDQKLIYSIGLSAMFSFVITFALWMISLFGWGTIFMLLSFVFIPIVRTLWDIWEENDCLDLKDLWYILTLEDEDKRPSLED